MRIFARYNLRQLDSLNHPRHQNLQESTLENRLTVRESSFIQSIGEVAEIPISCSVIPAHTHLPNHSQAELILDAESALICVNEYFQCLEMQETQLPRNITKAKVMAFLASRSQLRLRIAYSMNQTYWKLATSLP